MLSGSQSVVWSRRGGSVPKAKLHQGPPSIDGTGRLIWGDVRRRVIRWARCAGENTERDVATGCRGAVTAYTCRLAADVKVPDWV